MPPFARRRFLLGLAGVLPLPFLARRFHAAAVATLDPAGLRVLAGAVLPSELGPQGVERVVAGFERWLAGYREGAELLHGYGTGEIRTAGPSPALRWSSQLERLRAAARSSFHRSFPELTPAQRQGLVREALLGQRLGGLPQLDRAPHLAVGLLAFFYQSPEAADLCYGVAIGRNSCRPLALSREAPLPLDRKG